MTEPVSADGRSTDRPRVSIIVVSYNTREMTLECLRSVIREAGDVSYELLVVDNQSSDGSADAIAEEFPDLRLIRPEENLGFGRGNNLAAREATGDYLLLLNPDTVVLDHAIDHIVAYADEHPEPGIWGGRTLHEDRTLNPSSCWGRMTLWNVFCRTFGLAAAFSSSEFFNYEGYGGWKRDTVREVDIVTGCFLLIRHDLWRDLGGFDPVFFMYGEEADLCLRARRRGARPVLYPGATIIHHGNPAAFEAGTASDPNRAAKLVRVMKGKITLMRRHWPAFERPLGEILFRLNPLIRYLGYASVALLLRREKAAGRARIWRRVWKDRAEWLCGYE